MNKFIKSFSLCAMVALILGLAGVVSAATLTAIITSPASGTSATVGQTVTFNGSATGGNGPYDYAWNFSEGSPKYGPSATYAFTSVGTKNVVLTVTDSQGATANTNISVNVTTGASQKPVITNIATSNITQTGVTITWTTDIVATSRVIYDTTSHPSIEGQTAPNFGYAASTATDSNKVTSHSVTLSGLNPGTKYYFRVISEG